MTATTDSVPLSREDLAVDRKLAGRQRANGRRLMKPSTHPYFCADCQTQLPLHFIGFCQTCRARRAGAKRWKA